ncbi:MAG: alpha/beta hydrolase [Saprospiraceae bacterium]
MKKTLTLIILCFSISQLTAQTMSSIPLAKLETLHSDIVGEDYKLHITLPFGYNPNGKKYPVLYYLDAWSNSATVNEMALGMMWFKNIDPIIFVGISYETNPFSIGKLRKRDYQPPINELDKKNGGGKFLQFIKTELTPHIEKNYAADPNDRGLMGGSLGGLFCTYALKEEPQLFNRLNIISPALWHGEEYLLKDAELLENIKNANGLEVFIACGALEANEMISYANRLFDLVKENKNIQSHKVIFDEEDHGSVGLPATSRGIRYLYGNEYKILKDKVYDLYKKKEYTKALKTYQTVFEKHADQIDHGDHFDIACLYSLTNNSEKAFNHLQALADTNYKKSKNLITDTDLNNLHDDKRWKVVLANVKKNEELANKQ